MTWLTRHDEEMIEADEWWDYIPEDYEIYVDSVYQERWSYLQRMGYYDQTPPMGTLFDMYFSNVESYGDTTLTAFLMKVFGP